MTELFHKKEFIEMLQEGIPDDVIILLSRDKTGTVSSNMKFNQVKVSFAYAADAFQYKGDVRVFLNSPVVSFIVCKPEEISEAAIKTLQKKDT